MKGCVFGTADDDGIAESDRCAVGLLDPSVGGDELAVRQPVARHVPQKKVHGSGIFSCLIVAGRGDDNMIAIDRHRAAESDRVGTGGEDDGIGVAGVVEDEHAPRSAGALGRRRSNDNGIQTEQTIDVTAAPHISPGTGSVG
ncbi:MAG: hypothetical protein WBV61_05165 [Rhodanobacteraceae bacterium]